MSSAAETGRRSLRVAIVSPSFGGYGGLEAFSLAILRGLPSSPGLEVRLVFKRVVGFSLRPELGSAVTSVAQRAMFVDGGSGALLRELLRADVVHAMNPSCDVLLLAKALGRPVLVNVINHRGPGFSVRQRLWDFCLRQGSLRFYISEFVRCSWEGAARWPRSQVVFPICELPRDPKPLAQRRGFVFAARWIPNKGIDTLVEAYARAALDPVRWPLVLIGDGPLRPAIEQRVTDLGLRGVTMSGFLSQPEKAEAMRRARWMVVPPDTREDFGLTAIEARHVEVPCIVTRDGGVPEAAGEEALRCEPGDVVGLAECLRVAATMEESEYARRARSTRETLLPRLRGPEFYAQAYRELGGS